MTSCIAFRFRTTVARVAGDALQSTCIGGSRMLAGDVSSLFQLSRREDVRVSPMYHQSACKQVRRTTGMPAILPFNVPGSNGFGIGVLQFDRSAARSMMAPRTARAPIPAATFNAVE